MLLERFDLDPTKKGRTYSKATVRRWRWSLPWPRTSSSSSSTSRQRAWIRSWRNSSADASRKIGPRGGTVLLASHILAEVEALCDRVSIIRKGKTVESGTLSDLRHLTRTTISARVEL